MTKATKEEREWMGRVAALSCIVCRNEGLGDTPAMVHHIGNGTMGKRASNLAVIPLCPAHHQYGGHGVAVHAGRKYYKAVAERMAELGLAGEGIATQVTISLVMHHKMNVRYDVSNYLKAYEDALVKCGFLVDDHLIEYASIKKGEKVAGGKLVVKVNVNGS